MFRPESDIEDSLPGSYAEDMFKNYKLRFSDAASSIYSEDNTPLLSDAVSSIYTAGDEELGVINVRRAILNYTTADNYLTNEQVAEIQDEINVLRFSLVSDENLSMEASGHEDNQSESSRQKNIPEVNPSSYRLSQFPTPDTDDSSNEILSRVSSYFTARTSPALQDESEDVSTGQIYTSSIDEPEEPSRRPRSGHSSVSVHTSNSSPTELPEPSETISVQFKVRGNISSSKRALQLVSQLQSLLEQSLPIPGSFPVDKTIEPIPIETSEEINSSYSRSSASLSSLRDCSSTEELPSPASPTTQTTCLHEPETMPQTNRRPFSLDEAIEIDNYCEKRKTGLRRGQLWMDQFWGFESLQMLFVWKYGWKPEVERFENFWVRRQEQTDFWLLWDYPTNLV
jgi:hypothetical protein